MRFIQRVESVKTAKLDLKDKKILYQLAENSRTSYTQIAKKVGLSNDAVKYRIKNYEKEGIIQEYISVIDTRKIGYESYHIFLQLKQINKDIRKEIIKTLKSYNFIKLIIEYSGKYDFQLSVAAKNVEGLDKKTTKIIDDLSEYLQEHQIFILSKTLESRALPRSFLEIKEKEVIKKKVRKNIEKKLDDVDLKILKILSKNATQPLYKIGEKVGLSADAVNYRIKNLIKSEVILEFSPILNLSALGYSIYTIMINIHNLGKGKEQKLSQFLKTNKNILWAAKSIGKYNLLMWVCVKTTDEFHQTLINLRKLFSPDVKDYETLVAYEEYERNYLPDICLS